MLHELLAENRRRFHHTYSGGLTNHLPMCLGALRELGADDDRLRRFFDLYAQRLEPAVPLVGIVDVRADRGRAITDVLARAPGEVASGAFHGIIRLAWAVDSDDDDDVAHALHYLEATRGQTTARPRGAGRERSLIALAARLRSAGIAAPPGRLISTRLQNLGSDPAFTAVVDDLAIDIDINDMAIFGARVFAVCDDFSSLHIVTGADALITLAPLSTRLAEAIHAAAVAALGCFVLAGCPALDEHDHADVDDDATIARLACASDDDHVCKFAASCLRHAHRTGDRLFLALATRTVRRGVT
jgi:hypothetical protein